MQRKLLLLVAVVFVLASLTVTAQEKTAPSREDQELRVKVLDQLTLDHWLQGVMPQVTVESGVVKLGGKLKSEVYRKRIVRRVRETPGVKNVVDQMEIIKPN